MMIVRCRKCGNVMERERVDYDHIHWKCRCGYTSKTHHTTATTRVNPYDDPGRYPLRVDEGGKLSILSGEEREVELLSIEEISRLASSTEKIEDVLNDMVRAIAHRLKVDVCSVYLYRDNLLVLSATYGLSPRSVGKVILHLDEGITGHAAAGSEPVVVANAADDARYKYFEVAEEERYKGMIACPIRDGERLLGVLNIQTVKMKVFTLFEQKYLRIVANLIKNCLKIREKR